MKAFQVLKDGVSFDRKRFGDDFLLFAEAQEEPETVKKRKVDESGYENKVVLQGETIPDPVSSFPALFSAWEFQPSCSELVLKTYESPTLVQKHVIPIALNKRELIAIAPTGSGKTLSFLIPLMYLVKSGKRLRAMVLSPTKELAKQTYKELLLLSEGSGHRVLCLSKKSPEGGTWKDAYDIVIATPLLCVHLLGEASLKSLRYMVFDEVDQLLDMGFMEQIEGIMQKCRQSVVKWMFSATLMPVIELLAKSIMLNPVKIQIGRSNTTVSTVDQSLVFCSNELGKLTALRRLIHTGELTPPVLIFVQSKARAKELLKALLTEHIRTGAIHSDLSQGERDLMVKQFRQGGLWVLICTDLMSRGIDFKDVKLVLNYDFPQSMISYIHRIGRTGRAGHSGRALTYYTFEDAPYIRMVTNVMVKSGCEVPSWLQTLRNPSRKEKKSLETKPIKRERVSGGHGLSRTLRKKLHKAKVLSSAKTDEKQS